MRRSLVACLALAACATPRENDAAAAVAAALVGAYDNAAQYEAASTDMKRPPVADGAYAWIDRQSATFTAVKAPGVGAQVIFLEWRGGDGEVSRRRIWSFRRDGAGKLRMDFFTFKTPERFSSTADFTALTPADLIGYGDACALHVTRSGAGWTAAIDPAACRITARSGRAMGIAANVRLTPQALAYSEAGVLDGGRFAFKVPGVDAYDFRRRPPADR